MSTEREQLATQVDQIASRLAIIKTRLAAVGSEDIEIVAVSKTFPASSVAAASLAGLRLIGESYAQEFAAKAEEFDRHFGSESNVLDGGDSIDPVAAIPPVSWHFVGGLQRNKVRRIAHLVGLWQSVDRGTLAREIAKRAPGAEVLLQVDISNEETKGGCPPREVEALLDESRSAGLVVSGLMAIGPLAEPETARPGFALVRRMADELGLTKVSMGMSGDLEVAAGEGATMVRIGSALFGPRNQPLIQRAL